MEQVMSSLRNPEVLVRLQREFQAEIIEDSKREAERITHALQQRFPATAAPRHINPTKVNTTVRRAVHRVCVSHMGRR